MPGTVHDVRTDTDIDPELAVRLRQSADRTALTGQPDHETLAELRASGLLATAVPREYGGAGGDATDVNGVVERLARLNPSLAIMAFQHFAVSSRITEWGSPGQKRELLPRLADGTCLAASAWSEQGAGAAKRDLSSTAVRRPDGSWVLDGAKSFTTTASVADVYLVLVRTGDRPVDTGSGYGAAGQTFFLIEAGHPGLFPDLSLDLVGMRGSATGFVSMRECVVADTDRLGPEGRAAQIIAGVRESGASLGAVAVGAAQAAFELLVEHLRQRGQLASPVVRDRLVSMATRVESARAVVERAGARSSADPGTTTLHSKLHASAVAEEICLEAAGMLGSAGYTAASGINRLLSDVRAVALMGPTNALCRELVASTWPN
ncbi:MULTISPECIES: acyl-CoA dehydrogenase family protein [unclassified Streptomyces]|uniref:acyl-CoA dehydrogenase family protein n=1 Tax=unclassified Streptomyces TaxID=2593676 RepID=UPI002E117A5F|nr:acyl-CoA/acyl-ACP dehydrogenase [Streptomyces sp. NBC_01197]WSS50074.1 acyl-CoA/acyl-ACP dehydrogenase [Streptomyces sp. NBC_01180]